LKNSPVLRDLSENSVSGEVGILKAIWRRERKVDKSKAKSVFSKIKKFQLTESEIFG
jgi:hypothetical protein